MPDLYDKTGHCAMAAETKGAINSSLRRNALRKAALQWMIPVANENDTDKMNRVDPGASDLIELKGVR